VEHIFSTLPGAGVRALAIHQVALDPRVFDARAVVARRLSSPWFVSRRGRLQPGAWTVSSLKAGHHLPIAERSASTTAGIGAIASVSGPSSFFRARCRLPVHEPATRNAGRFRPKAMSAGDLNKKKKESDRARPRGPVSPPSCRIRRPGPPSLRAVPCPSRRQPPLNTSIARCSNVLLSCSGPRPWP